jgi:23S rRNA (adenine2030-N6)-methyltransferase
MAAMQYRHSFHAGNFADVHKHVALLALITAQQKKAKGFLFIDTHAGGGLHDLGSADARRSGESDAGIAQLRGAQPVHPALLDYLATLERLRESAGGTAIYPGSPLLAAARLRDVDQAICIEAHAQTARALQRALEQQHGLAATPRVITDDGYRQLRALLPPSQRRGLVLIDPPYEAADEEQLIAAALADALTRFETGVYALWYPIKKQYDTDLWLARITRGIERPTLAIELCLREPDSGAGLNGSGMLIVNPPWQFDTDAGQWQPELLALLGGHGPSTVRWLIHE